MDLGSLLYEVEGGVATITLNRPENYNSISDEMRDGLREAIARIKASDEVGVVVITGAGKAFCAGGDVKKMVSNLDLDLTYEDRLATYRKDVADMVTLIKSIEQPVIAKINGHAFGAGCSIAMLCDYRIAAESAKFGLPFGKRGLVPDWGASYFLPRLIGLAKAIELTTTGKTLTAPQALNYGLVDRIAPDISLNLEVATLCRQMMESGPVANRESKKLMQESMERSLAEALEQEAVIQSERYCSDEHKEGVRSFVEKRSPNFRTHKE